MFAKGDIDRKVVEPPAGEVCRDAKATGLLVVWPETPPREFDGELEVVVTNSCACFVHVAQSLLCAVGSGEVNVARRSTSGTEA